MNDMPPRAIALLHEEKIKEKMIQKPKKIKKPKVKKRTLEEFKSWLDGMQEFQEPTWTPNYEQWSHIKDSISVIIEPETLTTTLETHSTRSNPILNTTSVVNPAVNPVVNPVRQHLDMQKSTSLINNDAQDGNYTSDFE